MADSVIRLDDHGQIARVQRELRKFGSPATRKLYYGGLNRATKPMRARAKGEAIRILPKRGGLNARVAKTRLTTRSGGGGVYVTSARRSQARSIDQGRVRHPVFGNRDVWSTTNVRTGWFTRPMLAGKPIARRELIEVFNAVAKDIARRTTTT